MAYTNNAMLIRRELITRIGKLLITNQLEEQIDRIPLEMRPRNEDSSRCCVYKDRAVLKYKIMALLGFNIQDEIDELTPLSEYAKQAKNRKTISSTALTVVDEACSSCVKVNYEVTNLCRGCVGRPCVLNCPKDTISIKNGQAKIDHENCINCGKCQKACPYHAIIYQPIPCEEACPVGAIKKNKDGVEVIDDSKCINCGKCVIACPFGAVFEKSHLVEIFEDFHANKKVIAIPAPSIIGQFKAKYGQILESLISLGFSEVIEVAQGANQTTAHEAEEFQERIKEGAEFMTTSCCPAYTQAVDKHIPELRVYVSDTPTPMHYTAKLTKEKYPDATIVFIGPCVAKRSEAWLDKYVDYTLSFEELGAMLIAKGIDVAQLDQLKPNSSILNHGHGFASVGGVTSSIEASIPKDFNLKTLTIDGVDKATIKQLKTMAKGKTSANFIEVMSCEGGCIAGPNVVSNPKIAAHQLKTYIASLNL